MSTINRRSRETEPKTSGTIKELIDGYCLVDLTTAASELGICENQVRKLCVAGRLGSHVLGRFIITREELDEFKKIPRPVGRPPID